MRRRLYGGVDHADLSASLNNVGRSFEALGQRDEGVALMREALEMRRRLYDGIDHLEVATSLNNVRNSLEAMGQCEEGVGCSVKRSRCTVGCMGVSITQTCLHSLDDRMWVETKGEPLKLKRSR
jgi:hypothetical protein